MPRFQVTVADRHTGKERVLTISAPSPGEARAQAATDPTVFVGVVRADHNGPIVDDDLDRIAGEAAAMEYPVNRSPSPPTASAPQSDLIEAIERLIALQDESSEAAAKSAQAIIRQIRSVFWLVFFIFLGIPIAVVLGWVVFLIMLASGLT